MFRPTSDSPARRPDLGAIAYEAMSNAGAQGFIADQVMPRFSVSLQTSGFPVIPKEALFNVYDTKRQSTGRYNSYDGEFERGYYETQDHGLEERKDDRDVKIYQSEFDYERVIATRLTNNILRAREYRVAALALSTSTWTAVNASVAWSTIATATPVTDIELAKETMRKKGIPANCVIIPAPIYYYLKQTTDIINRVTNIFPDVAKSGNIGMEHVRAAFDIDYLLVPGALMNTANTGLAASLSDIWGSRYVQVCRIATGAESDVIEPCIGRQLVWNDGGGSMDDIVEEYYDPSRRSWMLRVRHDSVEKLIVSYDEDGSVKSNISESAGYLLDATAAT